MDKKIDVGDPLGWLRLDEALRHESYVTDSPSFADRLTEPRLALAMCHRDGRIRQAALDRVAEHPVLLPLLVIRCADWAAPVRERARQLLAGALDTDTAVALAPLILLFGRRGRGVFAVDLLDEALRRAPGERPTALFTNPDRTVRRYAYRLAVEESLLSPAELARAAARDTDAVVQSLCAEAALAVVARTGTTTRCSIRCSGRGIRAPGRPGSPRCGQRGGRGGPRGFSPIGPVSCGPVPGMSYGSTGVIRWRRTGSGAGRRSRCRGP